MILVLMVAGYLLGSIPVAWLVAKADTGQDLRMLGSGNVGVMNTALSVHRWAGLLVFAAEIGKGVLAVTMARTLEGSDNAVGLTALATIIGTRWPIWLRGQGGRGNTAAMAALLLISPASLAVVCVLYLAARWLMHSNFVAMRVSLVGLPIILGWLMQSWSWLLLGACFCLLFLGTHRPETDDHLLLKTRWPSFLGFWMAPPRH